MKIKPQTQITKRYNPYRKNKVYWKISAENSDSESYQSEPNSTESSYIDSNEDDSLTNESGLTNEINEYVQDEVNSLESNETLDSVESSWTLESNQLSENQHSYTQDFTIIMTIFFLFFGTGLFVLSLHN